MGSNNGGSYANNSPYHAEVETILAAAPEGDVAAAKAAYSKVFEDPKLYRTVYGIFGNVCRNCYLSGIGYHKTPRHSVADCKAMGNACAVECRLCHDGSCHWIDNCPNKSCQQQGHGHTNNNNNVVNPEAVLSTALSTASSGQTALC